MIITVRLMMGMSTACPTGLKQRPETLEVLPVFWVSAWEGASPVRSLQSLHPPADIELSSANQFHPALSEVHLCGSAIL